MTPLWAIDPINPIKMVAVVVFGFMCLALLLANRKNVNLSKYKLAFGLITAFIVWQFLVLFLSGGQFYQQLFGSGGRNTGFITYLAFSFLFAGSIVASRSELFRPFVSVVFVVGLASLAYGVIQSLGADPIDWVNPYSPVFGFLGNPNFQSSLLGILGTVIFAQYFVKGSKIVLQLI